MDLPTLAKKLKFTAPYEIPLYLPEGIVDNRHVATNFEPFLLQAGSIVICQGVVSSHAVKWSNGRPRLSITLSDGEYTVGVSLFGDQRKLQERLETQSETPLSIRGEVTYINQRMYLSHASVVNSDRVGYLTPTYPGVRGVARAEKISELIKEYLDEQVKPCAENLLAELSKNQQALPAISRILPQGIASLIQALLNMHRPPTLEAFQSAKLTMERLSILLAANSAMLGNVKGQCRKLNGPDFAELTRHVPFKPTDEQIAAAQVAITKISQGIRSHSLLVGDVGTGKTVVFAMVARYVVLANSQARVVVLLPNEALAHQIHAELSSYMPEIESALVTAESKGDINAPLVVGTSALLFKGYTQPVELLIVDESQKFSRAQREQIPCLHLMEASATPIPRTAALAQFGAVDVLILKKSHTPKDIVTRIWQSHEGDALMSSLQHTLSLNAKVLVVCPKRDEETSSNDESMVSAERIAFALNQSFPGRVRMMHSGLSTEENERALSDFKSHIDILVSTTKIEVGVTVPGLRHVIVYSAARLGLTQLHQIRGRLARVAPKDGGVNWGKFDLFLPTGAKERAMQRLQVLVDSQDGFYISEMDMRMRGVGDLDGKSTKQHGATDVGIRNVVLSVDRIASAIEYIKQS